MAYLHKPVFLTDLKAADAIEVTCTECRHWSLLAPHVLLARYPGSIALAAVLESARCSACGERKANWALLRARPPRSARDY